MYDKKLQLVTPTTAEVAITKEERYELIASIAQRFNESKELPDVENKQLWDSNDTNISFDDVVRHYN